MTTTAEPRLVTDISRLTGPLLERIARLTLCVSAFGDDLDIGDRAAVEQGHTMIGRQAERLSEIATNLGQPITAQLITKTTATVVEVYVTTTGEDNGRTFEAQAAHLTQDPDRLTEAVADVALTVEYELRP